MHSNSSWFPWGIIPSNGLKVKNNSLYVAFLWNAIENLNPIDFDPT